LRPYDAGVSDQGTHRAGLGYAVAAFMLWGLFPIYWKLLQAVPALEVVAHRTFWGFAALAVWITVRRRWADVRTVATQRRTLVALAGSAALISVNWLLYVWAVINGHMVEASLGYYINPLVNVVLGVIVLRERLSRPQLIAVTLAGIAVATLTLGYGRFPWIALTLAMSFGLYGLVRKTVSADAITGRFTETTILAPLAGGLIVVLAARGTGALGGGGALVSALLVLGGPITALPLALFAHGTRRLPLSTIGLIQYIAPSLQFLIAVVIYREPFTAAHAATFACIWLALGLMTWDLTTRLRVVRVAADAASR
jgi:chloramphenicol-sensitive protein RarD